MFYLDYTFENKLLIYAVFVFYVETGFKVKCIQTFQHDLRETGILLELPLLKVPNKVLQALHL